MRIKTGTTIHIHVGGPSDDRTLYPGVLVAQNDEGLTARFYDRHLAIEPGQDLLLFFEYGREFMQQSIRVDVVMAAGEVDGTPPDEATAAALQGVGVDPASGGLVVGFRTLGEPVSAENRECYRVSTVLSHLTATLDGESGCELLEVSVTGFGVIAENDGLEIGNVVSATLTHAGTEYTGDVCVQSRRELEPGRIRYGVHCVDSQTLDGNLAKGLQRISMDAQRQHLKRMSGTG